ncbi:alpha/beta hydrolase [Pseudomonas matsuisoli]|nr:alpha/beta hydrolase-fold protein [Pseudomonas matsuisoli]
MARPDLSKPVGPTIADQGSAHYRFSHFDLDSVDGERHYRIWVAEPKRDAPPSGYPVIYLLDGNAALATLDEALLSEMSRAEPPVIVAIGYATDLRFDTTARAYDYTPQLPGGQPVVDDIVRERKGGGADTFLDLIEGQIKPRVSSIAPVDLKRQTLWGHSYGGLFTLHALFTRPQSFQSYVAADPSIWWQEGYILNEEKGFAPPPSPIRVTLMRGMAERVRDNDSDAVSAVVKARRKATESVPPDAAARLAERLARYSGVSVSYRAFPELSHGPMLPVSLGETLRSVARVSPAGK